MLDRFNPELSSSGPKDKAPWIMIVAPNDTATLLFPIFST